MTLLQLFFPALNDYMYSYDDVFGPLVHIWLGLVSRYPTKEKLFFHSGLPLREALLHNSPLATTDDARQRLVCQRCSCADQCLRRNVMECVWCTAGSVLCSRRPRFSYQSCMLAACPTSSLVLFCPLSSSSSPSSLCFSPLSHSPYTNTPLLLYLGTADQHECCSDLAGLSCSAGPDKTGFELGTTVKFQL